MKTRILAVILGLMLAAPLSAELGSQTVTVTAASQTVTISGQTVLIINDDDADSVYVRVFTFGETAGDATTSNAEIKYGEGLSFSATSGLVSVSLIAGATKTASVRLLYL